MEHKIFSIYDQKAYAYLPPFTLPTADMAERTFMDCVNSQDHAFGRNPADYTLFELGTYDDNKGLISPHEVVRTIGNGIEYVKSHSLNPEGNNNGNIHAVGNGAPILPGADSGNPPVKL